MSVAGDSETPRLGKAGGGTGVPARPLDHQPPTAASETRSLSRDPRPYPGEIVGHRGPPYEVTGLDALSPMLGYVRFPATREEIVAQLGDVEIPVDAHHTRPVREILEQVTPNRFDSSLALEEAVARRWDQIARREGRGGRHPQTDNTSKRPR